MKEKRKEGRDKSKEISELRRQILALMGKKRSEVHRSWWPKDLAGLHAKRTQLLACLPPEERWKAMEAHGIRNTMVTKPPPYGTLLWFGRKPRKPETAAGRQ